MVMTSNHATGLVLLYPHIGQVYAFDPISASTPGQLINLLMFLTLLKLRFNVLRILMWLFSPQFREDLFIRPRD